MTRKRFYVIFFAAGIFIGIAWRIHNVRADAPNASPTSLDANVIWDERWRAIEAVVSTDSRFVYFNNFNNPTMNAGKIEKDSTSGWFVKTFPKMVITKWRVHGHIHFE